MWAWRGKLGAPEGALCICDKDGQACWAIGAISEHVTPQCTSDHGSLDASQPCSEGLLGSLIYIKMVTVSRGLWLGARWERMLGVQSLLVSLPPSNPGGGVVFRCAIREL